MGQLTEAMVTIATAIIGLAILAVLVSKNANTSGVLGAAGNAFSKSIGAAVAPVTGGSSGLQLPSLNSGGYFQN
jgi:hypothetical protein